MNMTEIFKALSNPTRLQILLWLKNPDINFPPQGNHPGVPDDLHGGVCVGSIRDKAGISQATASQYLDMMQRCGLLVSERHNKWTYYRRNEATISEFSSFVDKEL